MPQVIIKQSFEIADVLTPGGVPKLLTFKKSVAYTKAYTNTYTVAASTAIIVWVGADQPASGVTDFDLAIFISSGTLSVELTSNDGHASEELATIALMANMPLVIGADDSYYAHSASNAFGGTLDVIDKIRVYNATTSAVSFEVFLFT